MINPVRATIALADIAGISPLNPRHAEPPDDGIEALAASIDSFGLLQPLVCEERTEGILILNGRRRYFALQLLSPDGSRRVPVEIAVEADGAELRERALALDFHHEPLHPVTEYMAFADLALAGRSEIEIAKAFATGRTYVRRALKLARLAPEIRLAWRDGRIDEDAARAYALGDTHAQQLAVYEATLQRGFGHHQSDIRRRLVSDTIAATSNDALFVGEADYLAAGGRINDSLFDAEVIWLDGALAKKLAAEKLDRAGQDIAFEEGWGFVVPEAELADYLAAGIAPDYQGDEALELEGLHQALEAADGPVLEAELAARIAAIETRAILRAIPAGLRHNFGLCASLEDGRLTLHRGLRRREAAAAPVVRAGAGEEKPAPKQARPPPPPPAAPEQSLGATLRAVLDAAINAALRDIVAIRPDIALAVCIAAATTGEARLYRSTSSAPRNELNATLRSAIREHRADPTPWAMAALAPAPLADLIAAFAEMTALSIDVAEAAQLSELVPLMTLIRARGGGLREALLAHFDAAAYFNSATKQAAVAAIEALDGPAAAAEARKQKRQVAADRAAILARDKAWLPELLAQWCALPAGPQASPAAQPLAEAMLGAIEADERSAA